MVQKPREGDNHLQLYHTIFKCKEDLVLSVPNSKGEKEGKREKKKQKRERRKMLGVSLLAQSSRNQGR